MSRRLLSAPVLRMVVISALLVGWPGPVLEGASPPRHAPGASAPDSSLLLLAPASLADVMPRVAAAWQRAGGPPLRLSVDATSRLAPQVAEGVPAHLFVSADRRWMDWARERGAVGDPVVLLRNHLAVIVPAGAPDVPSSPAELATWEGVRLALAGENVPAGRYARAALEAAGVWGAVADRVVRGGSVRGALEWVARGEADAGIVYATDARAEPRVRVAFTFSPAFAPEIAYPAAIPTASPDPQASRALLAFLGGPEATALFREAGFEPVAGDVRASDTASAPVVDARAPTLDPFRAVRLSLVVGLLAALVGFAPAVAAGWLLARRSFRGKSLLSTVLLAPLVLPPVVTGFLLLMLLGREGVLGGALAAAGLAVPFTVAAPVVAALVVGFPLYVVAVRGAFEAVDPRYEEVSWTLGRPPAPTFFRVALPLALPGVAAGAVLAFARALGEFGATIVLAGNVEGETRTIPLAVYTLLEAPGGGRDTWLLVGASVLLSLLALLGYEALSRRQRDRLEDRRGR